MRTKLIVFTTAIAALCLTAARPALAHHAFGGEFDPDRPVL